ncbi:MAG: hypothetical protein GTO53_13135 [Planctomycetales bacterium]|nr:hypothetical protein [Planctomycetales bacterium]NIM10042.1 hypothetical protein [Planctomycetales bacterium]NIN09483.1 hypothetical protein [Planctomycetales bacterium]NIN78591.1 hypothetical protein [Planctomycetales bacterium]NIO35785.1 hypothetical protein [Planctomycetales bacterium]
MVTLVWHPKLRSLASLAIVLLVSTQQAGADLMLVGDTQLDAGQKFSSGLIAQFTSADPNRVTLTSPGNPATLNDRPLGVEGWSFLSPSTLEGEVFALLMDDPSGMRATGDIRDPGFDPLPSGYQAAGDSGGYVEIAFDVDLFLAGPETTLSLLRKGSGLEPGWFDFTSVVDGWEGFGVAETPRRFLTGDLTRSQVEGSRAGLGFSAAATTRQWFLSDRRWRLES